jgi:fatty acid desaturase
MALILFSLGEATKVHASRVHQYFLFALALVAIIDNGIALSAIGYRLVEFGITPNRLVVLGSNALIMVHLILTTKKLWGFLKGHNSIEEVEGSLTAYLAIYAIWAAIVSFVFPLVFQFA